MDRLVNDDVRCRTARHWRRTANSWEAASKAFDFFFRSSSIHPELVVRYEGRYGRTSTALEPLERGLGPECVKHG
jgi:hypothetical protein